MQKKDKEDLRAYRTGRLKVLELLAVVAVAGFILTWIVKHFFMS